jgi:hypothetical protein
LPFFSRHENPPWRLMQMLLTTRLDLSKAKGKMSVLLENKVCAIDGAGGSAGGSATRKLACEGARMSLEGRTQSKCDLVPDGRLHLALSHARVAVRLAHGCTVMEGTYVRSSM